MNTTADRDEMREGIVDAAERLMALYGYRKMTMTDLAVEAGIGVGTTYLYFSGKDEVALAVVEKVNRRVLAQMEALAHAEEPARSRLRALLIARVMLRFEITRPHPHRHREEFRKAVETALRVRRTCWQKDEVQLFVDVLQSGQAAGEFIEEQAEDIAQTLLGAMNSLMPKNLCPEDFETPERVRDRTERLADLLLRAVAVSPAD